VSGELNPVAILGRKLRTAVRVVRQDPKRFLDLVRRFRFDRYVVFSAPTSQVAPPTPLEGATFRKLSDAEVETLKDNPEEIGDWVRDSGFNAGYGVFYQDKMAHVAWLIPAHRDRERSPRLVELQAGEAEITYCYTFPDFRGLGVYGYSIRNLFQVARESQIQEIFMITKVQNTTSQRGILKAGLSRRRGKIYRFLLLHGHLIYRRFRKP